MSTKIYPFESPRVNSARKKSKDVIDLETETDTTKSPRPSPRVRGSISRQNSITNDEARTLSRQNSFQNRSAGRRRITGLDDDSITDHSSSSARGKGKRKSSRGITGSKKKVAFKVPLIDPRPERTVDYNDASATYGADNSFNEYDYAGLEGNDLSYTPRRMKKRRNSSGKWRRWIPFGQYIPRLPSLFG